MKRAYVLAVTFALAGIVAAGVGRAQVIGPSINLGGSEALHQVTLDVIAACSSQFTVGNTSFTWTGGGSGNGAFGLRSGTQQIAPMTRPLASTEYCGVSINGTSTPIQGTTETLLLGLDAVEIFAGTANACGAGVDTAGGIFNVTDASGNPVVDCPGCQPGTSTYALTGSLDVLRLIYGGFHHDGTTFDCGGNVRRSLVKSWSALFDTPCTTGACAGGLTHAWRRSDLTGATEEFIHLIGFGKRQLGQFPSVGTGKATNPFCNGADATAAHGAACGTGLPSCPTNQACDTSGFCMPASNAGSTDFSDKDPIRVPCTANDQVCNTDYALGLVLPILLPDNPTNAPPSTDVYPTTFCSPGRFDLVSTGNVHDQCPGGPSYLGQCFQPYFLTSTSVHQYNCIARANAHSFGSPVGFEGRVWNLPVKQGASGTYDLDAYGRELTGSFFRIHTTLASTGSTTTCQQLDSSQQISCLVQADPCSIGFTGHDGAQAGAVALAIDGVQPTDTNIQNLFVSGAAPAYQLSSPLLLNTLIGFANLTGDQKSLAQCFGTPSVINPIITARGFVSAPAPVQCIDYDETLSTSASPFPGCGSATNSNFCP
jgi:ABC-type phosphate transport system substrate-binding protein